MLRMQQGCQGSSQYLDCTCRIQTHDLLIGIPGLLGDLGNQDHPPLHQDTRHFKTIPPQYPALRTDHRQAMHGRSC